MKKNLEIDYVEAILAMRRKLSISNTPTRKLEIDENVSVEVVDRTDLKRHVLKP